ncbi:MULTISPECIES: Calx-beta domain-containing protein [unclassified Nostoc]|uniref:Calx-beta domain-containing protein n=1 Tax=unclassified Nostoc TaxID=2593658 RepID=UPI002AD41F56|nr:Calx-beta domain-containing protein [Nostoc sp. DedQUE03]MDZ7971886.1 Calx-beta domain-containing protein [Nostoc sp. DedQUE03]MDZ8045889.1 Calx-beta domain-containing protein [Nostoc sp. DedQUE02]
MTNFLNFVLPLIYNQLSAFSDLENFWNLFDNVFGTQYNRTIAATVRSQWQAGDFSELPQIEVISSDILGNANGAYASSTNKIYLLDSFVATAAPVVVSAVLLEEIGHFVDAQINQKDTLGDEGELFSALVRGQSLTNQDLARISTENDWATITVAGQIIAVEQAELNFSVTFNDPLGTFSPYYSAIQSHILAAGSYWDNYIEGNASLEVLVDFSNPGPTATGRSVTASFVRNNGTFNVFEQGATAEIRTGIDPNGADPDIEFNFNSDYLTNELWFDPDPSARITPVPNDRTDAVSVFLHEFGHAFAFNGWRNAFDVTFPGDYQSTFDEQTIFDGSNFFFVGTQATSVYGSSVPLTYGNSTHVGNDFPRPGSDLIADLMNGVVYYRGTHYNISPLDVAILQDSGVPIAASISNITLALTPSSVTEDGSSNLVYTFTRNGSTSNALTVNYGVAGSATLNTDYTQSGAASFSSTAGTITFAAGASTATLIINPTADTTIESNETVALTLNSGTGYTVGTTTAVTGTIIDDDLPSITIAVAPSSVNEDGSSNLVYTFARSKSTTNALTVNYGVAGSATLNTDYTQTGAASFNSTKGSISFAASASTATLIINPTADTTIESNETVALTLNSGTGYTSGTTTAVTGTIINDDLPLITLAVAPSSVTEDGSSNLVYTFTRSGSTSNALTVNYGVAGSATFNSDYTQTGAASFTSTTGSITFAAGASTRTLIINPTADTTIESNETVTLTLNSGTGYTRGTTTAVTGTITNDDLLSINLSASKTIVEGNTIPQNVSYTVSLSQASNTTVTVQYATANGTATAGLDYTSTTGTLTFNPGNTSKIINIPILNDSLNEANETFTLTLTSPTNASLSTTKTVTTTITDTLTASVTTILPTNVENLTLTGTSAINGTGNAGNNILKGNSANNSLAGGAGNDTYSFVANSALGTDTITETTTGGTDTINFSGTTVAVNLNLGSTTSQTVNTNLKLILSANNVIENATSGTGNDTLTGNTLNNTLIGGDGNDQLQGLAGNDNLQGGNGNDTLTGGTGDDVLWGGLGNDFLTGNAGKDKYQFQANGVFSTSLGVDNITQFEVGQDLIVLSKTTFNAVSNNVGQVLTDFAVVNQDQFVNASNAHIVYSRSTGSLFYNQDGNVLGAGKVFEFATLGNPNITLSNSNFSLIA